MRGKAKGREQNPGLHSYRPRILAQEAKSDQRPGLQQVKESLDWSGHEETPLPVGLSEGSYGIYWLGIF